MPYCGDCAFVLKLHVPDNSVDLIVTSPQQTPVVNSQVVLQASCSGEPTAYEWTNCSSPTNVCKQRVSVPGVQTYSVRAVNSGGTLLLGASNQINNTASITLGGGTFAKGNFNEGSVSSAGVGALTLTATGSTLDFGIGTVGVLEFASFTANSFMLTIANWTGTANTLGNSGTDRLIFGSDQTSNLGNFSFAGYGGAMQFDLGGGYFEIVGLTTPVPEPGTYAAGLLAAFFLCYHQRSRLQRARKKYFSAFFPQPFTK